MSTSKHIELICAAALLCTLVVTGLFMHGTALGIQVVTDADAGDSYFTANDLNGDWDTTNATQITLNGDDGSVKGNGAYVYNGDVHIVYAGRYVISGELTNGSIIVDADGDDKIWILLDGVSLHCDDSAAIVVEQAGKVFLTLADGKENVISCGAEYSEDAVSHKIDGAIYARDDLTINGGGSLIITAQYKHGIVANDDLVVVGGHLDITAAQDGIHAHDSARFADVDITINAGDDGITVSNDDETGYVYVESGSISIPACYEGIEAIDITIAGGTIDIRPTDDGINANGRGGNSIIRITGGDITIINENGRDADGLDSNGSIDISGGNILISVNTSSYALDYGSENGGMCLISGGRVIAAGGSAMAEGFDSSSEQNFIMYNTTTAAAGMVVALQNQAGETLVSETIPCPFSSLVISTPELQLGETCTISIGDSAAEITVDNTSSAGGFGMGGMRGGMGGGNMRGGMFGGGRMNRFSGEANVTGGDIVETAQGAAPELPDGEAPQMPDGEFPGGEMPQGNFGRGGMRGREDGEMPTPPDGQGEMGGNRRGGDQFMERGQHPDWAQSDTATVETSALTPDDLLPVGVSMLFLLTGLAFAFKVKH